MKRILIIGYSNDSTINYFLSHISKCDCDFHFIDLHELYTAENLELVNYEQMLLIGRSKYKLKDYLGIYQRLMHPTQAEEYLISNEIANSRFNLLKQWLILFQGNLVNPFFSGWENSSKILQSYLMLKQSKAPIPLSLATSNKKAAKEFIESHKRQVIYKSNSCIRSIVNSFTREELNKLDNLRYCPSLLQKQVIGSDVRIHSVGSKMFAVKILTDAVDYRYHTSQGSFKKMTPLINIPDRIKHFVLDYTTKRNIIIAGFDFKVSKNGKWYCLEMNPMPGYDGYDEVLEGVISNSLLNFLLSNEV